VGLGLGEGGVVGLGVALGFGWAGSDSKREFSRRIRNVTDPKITSMTIAKRRFMVSG
jgi:hypothetical protein